MSNESVELNASDSCIEFSRLFWLARKEHNRLRRRATSDEPGHKAATEFARLKGWRWGEELIEISRLSRSGENEAAFKILTQCENLVPAQHQGLLSFIRGSLFQTKGDFDAALTAYRKALDNPIFYSAGYAWNNIGSVLQAQGEIDKAVEAYHKALADPNYDSRADAWNNLGSAFHARGRVDEAIKFYRSALEDPKCDSPGQAWTNLGHALKSKGKTDEAIDAFRQAVSDPKYDVPGGVWYNMGNGLEAIGKLDEAIEAYRNALGDPLFESPGIAWNNLGNVLHAKGQVDEAVRAFRNATRDPKLDKPGNAWYNLGISLFAKGELDEAAKAYQNAVKDPNFDSPGDAWNNLGTALLSAGKIDEGILAYQKALKDPNIQSPEFAWFNLGGAHLAKGELDDAIRGYQRALEFPNLQSPGHAWNNLGTALQAKGRLDDAVSAYKKAINDANYDTPAKAWTNLGLTYFAQGQPKLAEEAFKSALTFVDHHGGDHVRARLGLQVVQSKIAADALSPDDRALVGIAGAGKQSEEIESDLVAAIQAAGETQYEKYISKPDSKRDDTLSILRGWSSAVTLLDGSERRWRGGGYFLKWRGCGIVVDPGFDFLRNFHDAGYHGREIRAVVVSHNHPDHNSDLKDIDDLRYELYKRLAANRKPGSEPYVILWDQDTSAATKFLIEKPEHHHEPIIFTSGLPQPVNLSKHNAGLPVQIIPFNVKHDNDVCHAMGFVIELFDSSGKQALRIGYSADTGYFEDLTKHLGGCDILIAHISQPSIEELQDASKSKKAHLGYRGTARLIKECKPKLALIGEFWAGLTDLRIPIVKGLRLRSGIEAIFPAGLAMHVKLPSLEVECTDCKQLTSFTNIKVAPPAENFGNLSYLCQRCLLH